MAARPEPHIERIAVAVDLATRIVRLLAWMAVFAASCLTLWLLLGQAAQAVDPKAAARAIGQTGQTRAGAIARDARKASSVPGHAGTNVPERNLTAGELENTARARLADPDDPGGAAGRAVFDALAVRPAVPVAEDDPALRRAEAVTDEPQARAHGAADLASGGVAECPADVAAARRGGSCGSARYCVGAGCETVAPQRNTGFARSAAMLNMVLEMGGERGFDRERLRLFTGERRTCTIRWFGLADCCRNTGVLVGFANCPPAERELAEQRHAGNTRYLGKYCARRSFFGFCRRRGRAWCVFGSKLGRILHEQARPQLGIGWGDCRGFTVAEIERIDFDRLDLSEFTENLVDGSRVPSIALPARNDAQRLMQHRVRDFYRRAPR